MSFGRWRTGLLTENEPSIISLVHMNSGRSDDAIDEPWYWFGERDYAWG